ncbi:MAG: hypothetical protein M3N93_00145 [Acidobacteriota bacterium]|nr:hypothetical protein [Acidobacteriota bacterium]
MRLFPAVSDTAVFQVLSERHETEVLVVLAVSSNNTSGEELAAPAAVFQLALETTPAFSVLAIGVVLAPAKSTLIAPEAAEPPPSKIEIVSKRSINVFLVVI